MLLPQEEEATSSGTFKDLGLVDELCKACAGLGFKGPTSIQTQVLPAALAGKDIIGVAQTGSGKTAAYTLPVLQYLLTSPTRKTMVALVMCPTRELAEQVSQHIKKLGAGIGIKVACITGGASIVEQATELQKKPHIIVGTPGRLQDHFVHQKGFHMNRLKFLVFDEADRMLKQEFDHALNDILPKLPTDRVTYLFSATMTSAVEKLQKAALNNPVRVEIDSLHKTVATLDQRYIFIPFARKQAALVQILQKLSLGNGLILVFCEACHLVQRLCHLLRIMGITTLPLSGQMSQSKRQLAIQRFRDGRDKVLVATDVASRGLDIPQVDVVINYSLPLSSKEYIHRVGRTARAGRAGLAINFVTQYDTKHYKKIEEHIKVTTKLYEQYSEEETKLLGSRVNDAEKQANAKCREMEQRKQVKQGGGDDHKVSSLKRTRTENEKKFKSGKRQRTF